VSQGWPQISVQVTALSGAEIQLDALVHDVVQNRLVTAYPAGQLDPQELKDVPVTRLQVAELSGAEMQLDALVHDVVQFQLDG